MFLGSHRHTRPVEAKCDIKNCTKEAERSFPKDKVQNVLTQGLKDDVGRRAFLCKEHYKEFKKKTKTERITDRLAWKE
jgi:hypothetical protein